jgi:hypothetical protein
MVNIEFHGVKTLSKSAEIQTFFRGVGQYFPHGALVVRYRYSANTGQNLREKFGESDACSECYL